MKKENRRIFSHPSRDGNEAGFWGTRPSPPIMGQDFILINRYEIFFKNPGRVRVLSHPVPIIYKINFKIKFNLNFKINLI